jgi:hypothetical protein
MIAVRAADIALEGDIDTLNGLVSKAFGGQE